MFHFVIVCLNPRFDHRMLWFYWRSFDSRLKVKAIFRQLISIFHQWEPVWIVLYRSHKWKIKSSQHFKVWIHASCTFSFTFFTTIDFRLAANHIFVKFGLLSVAFMPHVLSTLQIALSRTQSGTLLVAASSAVSRPLIKRTRGPSFGYFLDRIAHHTETDRSSSHTLHQIWSWPDKGRTYTWHHPVISHVIIRAWAWWHEPMACKQVRKSSAQSSHDADMV